MRFGHFHPYFPQLRCTAPNHFPRSVCAADVHASLALRVPCPLQLRQGSLAAQPHSCC